jgi:homocysteine S-methyltransferase
MARYRSKLPQLDGELFLTDAGLETDLIFNHGIEIREFAAHTLLEETSGRAALAAYLRGFLALADEMDTGFILDSQTWKAHRHWAGDLGQTPEQLRSANQQAIAFIAELRAEAANRKPVVLNGVIGPCGDAYQPDRKITVEQAHTYFAEQLGWLAATEIDMVTALTFNQASEATGFLTAAQGLALPAVVSFTVETDGRLPDGQPLAEAIMQVDAETNASAAYLMVNCAHPDHFGGALDQDAGWTERIRGVRANASRLSHAELDEAPELDSGDPHELADQYRALAERMPWMNIFGGCCGSDLRHVSAIARSLPSR